MKKFLFFLKDYWVVPFLIAGVLGAFLFWKLTGGKKGFDPIKQLADTLKIIQSGANAREVQINLGTEIAIQQVKDKYAAKRELLAAEQKQKALELENDPVELARFLESVTRG